MLEDTGELGPQDDQPQASTQRSFPVAGRVILVAMLASAGCFAPARGRRPLRGCGCELEHDEGDPRRSRGCGPEGEDDGGVDLDGRNPGGGD